MSHPQEDPRPETYVVEAGDTLSGIAERFYGDAGIYTEIADANGIADPNLINVGQELVLPLTYAEQDVIKAQEAAAAQAEGERVLKLQSDAAAAEAAAKVEAEAAAKAAADAAAVEAAKKGEEDKAYDDMMVQAKANAAASTAALHEQEAKDAAAADAAALNLGLNPSQSS